MTLILITGMSGAGKSLASNALEDLGYRCVDNLPPQLLPGLVSLCQTEPVGPAGLAVVLGLLSQETLPDFFAARETLRLSGHRVSILFLDAQDSVLLDRYNETRRSHPLLRGDLLTLAQAVEAERTLLTPLRECADYVFDTSLLSAPELRAKLAEAFAVDGHSPRLRVNCMSFGYKRGTPHDADLVFDVRCLPNPYYLLPLRRCTGLDAPVRDYLCGFAETLALREKVFDLVDYMLPLFIAGGKSQLTVAFGCTGGRHRSVFFAHELAEHLRGRGLRIGLSHREQSGW